MKQTNQCHCGEDLPKVANNQTPYQYCCLECKLAGVLADLLHECEHYRKFDYHAGLLANAREALDQFRSSKGQP